MLRRDPQGYVDGSLASRLPAGIGTAPPDLRLGTLTIGHGLTGARIARAFACPTADPAACN